MLRIKAIHIVAFMKAKEIIRMLSALQIQIQGRFAAA